MAGRLHDVYHAMPYPGRVLMASARGYQLRTRRLHGLEALVTQYAERDWWTAADWATWQAETLRTRLREVAAAVPYYRERGATPSGDRVEDLSEWPVLTKAEAREHQQRLVRDDRTFRRVPEPTSGTSGTPIIAITSPDVQRHWYARFEWRWRRWHGVSRHDRWSNFGGQLVAPVDATSPPYWVWNAGLRQLYCSTYHLRPDTASAYLEALRSHRVTWLLGYPSALASVAAFAERQGLSAPPMRVVISNAEPLFAEQRAVLQRVFGAPVRDTYGMSEMVGAAGECDAGTMHWWPDAGHWEILGPDDRPVPPGVEGRLILTGLANDVMPLVRYEIGDRAVAPPGMDEPCPCGRGLPRAPTILGRDDDMVILADGRRVGRLDPVFKADLPIREAQIIQETVDEFRILVAPDRGFTVATAEGIIAALRERVGPVSVELDEVEEIPKTANGKFRAVISRVDPAEASDPA